MDYIVHGILQARTLKGVASPFSRGSYQYSNKTQFISFAARLPVEPQEKPEDIKKEIKIHVETNENKTTPNRWDSVKAVLRWRFVHSCNYSSRLL